MNEKKLIFRCTKTLTMDSASGGNVSFTKGNLYEGVRLDNGNLRLTNNQGEGHNIIKSFDAWVQHFTLVESKITLDDLMAPDWKQMRIEKRCADMLQGKVLFPTMWLDELDGKPSYQSPFDALRYTITSDVLARRLTREHTKTNNNNTGDKMKEYDKSKFKLGFDKDGKPNYAETLKVSEMTNEQFKATIDSSQGCALSSSHGFPNPDGKCTRLAECDNCPLYYKNIDQLAEWMTLPPKEFTKSDLKSGMLVEHADGKIGLIVNGSIIFNKEALFGDLQYYNDKLESTVGGRTLDIIRVSNVKVNKYLLTSRIDKGSIDNDLLWERPPVVIPEYTMEELVKLVGKDFKIKK